MTTRPKYRTSSLTTDSGKDSIQTVNCVPSACPEVIRTIAMSRGQRRQRGPKPNQQHAARGIQKGRAGIIVRVGMIGRREGVCFFATHNVRAVPPQKTLLDSCENDSDLSATAGAAWRARAPDPSGHIAPKQGAQNSNAFTKACRRN